MRLAPEGLREWGSATVLATIVLVALWLLCPLVWLNWTMTAIVGAPWIFIVQFFRDPTRHAPVGIERGDFVSPADGVVNAIETVDSHEAIEGPAIIIRIFLNVFNVHVNRVPCDATVINAVYRQGKFLDARKPESALVNESNLIRMHRFDGLPIGVRQVSGAIARRIVCTLTGGEQLVRGQRMGMIKFGSTTELILPATADVNVRVAIGEAVRGGRTLLASVACIESPTKQDERSTSA
jgi:phosphatidylserine decarboxylase